MLVCHTQLSVMDESSYPYCSKDTAPHHEDMEMRPQNLHKFLMSAQVI